MSKVVVDKHLFMLAMLALNEAGGESKDIANRLEDEMFEFSDANYSLLKEKAKKLDALMQYASIHQYPVDFDMFASVLAIEVEMHSREYLGEDDILSFIAQDVEGVEQ